MRVFCAASRPGSRLCVRKRDDVGLFSRNWRECHTLRLSDAVFAPQVAVGFHCQRAAILVPEPARNGGNIDARLNAAGREQVPEIVMRYAIYPHFFACSIKRLLALFHPKYLCIQWLVGTLA